MIEEFCEKYKIDNYTLNSDGSIDIDGEVNVFNKLKEKELPIEINKVTGTFDASFTNLTTLKGCPKEVGRSFFVVNCDLNTSEYLPEYVEHVLDLSHNQLTEISLTGVKKIGRLLNLSGNKITELYGITGMKEDLAIGLNETPVGSLYKFETIHEVNIFNMLKIINGNQLDLRRLRYFFTLVEEKDPFKIEDIDSFYKIN